jgi:hypothetical protein
MIYPSSISLLPDYHVPELQHVGGDETLKRYQRSEPSKPALVADHIRMNLFLHVQWAIGKLTLALYKPTSISPRNEIETDTNPCQTRGFD